MASELLFDTLECTLSRTGQPIKEQQMCDALGYAKGQSVPGKFDIQHWTLVSISSRHFHVLPLGCVQCVEEEKRVVHLCCTQRDDKPS